MHYTLFMSICLIKFKIKGFKKHILQKNTFYSDNYPIQQGTSTIIDMSKFI